MDDNYEKIKRIKAKKISLERLKKSEFNQEFIEYMENRMLMSFFKYSYMKDSFENGGVLAIENAIECIKKYLNTGNTEYLVDGANYLMCEFTYPQHNNAHFQAMNEEGWRIEVEKE